MDRIYIDIDIHDIESCVKACRMGHLEYIRRYVASGGDVEARESLREKTLITCASEYGQANAVKVLLDFGADINAKSKIGWTPIMHASQNGHESVIKFLARHGADLESFDNMKWTSIMLASFRGRENIVRLLADLGANINAVNNGGFSPIMMATASPDSNEGVVRALVELGADLTKKNCDGRTALDLAVENGNASIASMIAIPMIQNIDIPYSDVPVSAFIPRCEETDAKTYAKVIAGIIPVYLDRAIGDPSFGRDLECGISKIVGEVSPNHRIPLTKNDVRILVKLHKALRSIDYTDRELRARSLSASQMQMNAPSGASGAKRAIEDICVPKNADGRTSTASQGNEGTRLADMDMEL